MDDQVSAAIILLSEAKSAIQAEKRAEAAGKLSQAYAIAKAANNVQLMAEIVGQFQQLGQFVADMQRIEMNPIETKGWILDIGGGGEGIIGQLNGRQVVAIDTSREALEETQNDALKVVMDATDLRFLSASFDRCTAFFSLMYIPAAQHLTVFQEAYRVLKPLGEFLLWDVTVLQDETDCSLLILPLEIRLPVKTVETGYGVRWHKQDMEGLLELAKQSGFECIDSWKKEAIFHIRLRKPQNHQG
jgi:SAM-dependent methyltransferase